LLVASLLVAGVGLALVLRIPRRHVVYSRSVADQVERRLHDTPVRVQGYLVPGSLCKLRESCEFRFRLRDVPGAPGAAGERRTPEPPTLTVRYPSCTVPDNFSCDPVYPLRLTVEGTQCATCHELEASKLFASCSGKYDINQRHAARVVTPTPVCAL
jgi:hypothetical protein